MEMYSVTRRIQFCAGHRVYKHESKCSNLHGHNYVMFIHARPLEGLDSIGRVIDFSVLKQIIGDWVNVYWDHGFILYREDPVIELLGSSTATNKMKFFVMKENPTAENMAMYMLKEICPMLLKDKGCEVYAITLHETENCFAEVRL